MMAAVQGTVCDLRLYSNMQREDDLDNDIVNREAEDLSKV